MTKHVRASSSKPRILASQVRTASASPSTSVQPTHIPAPAGVSRETTSIQGPHNLRESEQPLPRGRRLAADSFDGVLAEAWSDEHYHLSNRAIAERDLHCDERIVRKWRTGEKVLPLGALYVLPIAVVRALIKDVQEARGIK